MENYETEEDYSDLVDCEVRNYDNPCSQVLETKEFDKILKHCNFTMKADIIPIKRTRTGVLLQGEEISVKELDKTDKLVRTVLPDKYPVHIVTNNHLAITLNDREIILQSYYNATERKVEYSYLSTDFIASMTKSAKHSDLMDELEFRDFIDLVFALLFIILVPITFALCVKSLELSLKCTGRKARAKNIIKDKRKQSKQRTNQNYEENTSFFDTRI
jgi:hypothetical protein